jgi:hypothetical protein
MKKYLIAAVLLVCGVPLYAQGSGAAPKAAVPAAVSQSTRTARGAQPAAAVKKAVKPAAAKPAPDKQADQENEDSVVMIDSKGDAEDNGSFSAGEDREERTVPGGIPSSFGQCKGTITEGGRSLLVFESADDGTLSFVQVAVGKARVTWKLVDRIPRSAD